MIRTPVQARKANAFAERWVATVPAECPDWMLVLGRGPARELLPVHFAQLGRAVSASTGAQE